MPSFNDNLQYFRQLIVKHYRQPVNYGLTNQAHSLQYHQSSTSCVDDFYVEIVIVDKIITSARFSGIGCAISTAALDIFCQLIEQKIISQVKKIIIEYQKLLANKICNEPLLANLVAFKNVYRQPNRVKCALIGIEGMLNFYHNGDSDENN